MRKMICALVLCAAGWTGSAMAADNGVYFGAGFGQANVEVDLDGDQFDTFDIDDDNSAWKLIAGIRPLDWLAIEANYVNFGEIEQNGLEFESDGVSAFVVGFLPFGPVDVYAKGGLITWDTSAAIERGPRIYSEDGTDLAYGVGAQFRIWSLSARLEYEVFDIDDVDDLNMISVGLTFTFL